MKRANPPNFDASSFRDALSQFATGVTVITTRAESGQLIGITASSFNSVSLDPPLVLWSLATKSASMPVFQANSHYVINVLASTQVDLCKRFATVKGDRFAGVSHAAGDTGMPFVLSHPDAAASVELFGIADALAIRERSLVGRPLGLQPV